MKELIKLAVDLEDPIEVIQKLRKEYRDYLTVRVRVKEKSFINLKKEVRLLSPLLLRLCESKLTNNQLTVRFLNRSDTFFIIYRNECFSFHVCVFHLFNVYVLSPFHFRLFISLLQLHLF